MQNFIIVLTLSYKCSTLASPHKQHRCNWNHRSLWTRVPILAPLQVISPAITYELCRWNNWKWSSHVRSHAAPRRPSSMFSHDPLYSSRSSSASPGCIGTSFKQRARHIQNHASCLTGTVPLNSVECHPILLWCETGMGTSGIYSVEYWDGHFVIRNSFNLLLREDAWDWSTLPSLPSNVSLCLSL